jgi:hypothetical protein
MASSLKEPRGNRFRNAYLQSSYFSLDLNFPVFTFVFATENGSRKSDLKPMPSAPWRETASFNAALFLGVNLDIIFFSSFFFFLQE